MMTSLFSMFDPSNAIFSFSWVVCFFVLYFLPGGYFMFSSVLLFFKVFVCSVKGEIDYVLSHSAKASYSILGASFLLLSFYNFFALFPFVFSVTSHLLVTFPFAFSLWLATISFSWFKSFKSFLDHLIPAGTPLLLMSFMVLVELLSNFIRPIALTFRLTANMMAGHLLMALIGGFLVSLPFSGLIVGSILQMFLVSMELGVSLIQSYVFTTLLLLYLSESDH